MHDYRRFVQSELDARGWDAAELVRRSGLRRQHIWLILKDDRDTLGRMPDDATLEALATAFNIPTQRIRMAASRSLDGYVPDGQPVTNDIADVPTEVLIEELRRRVSSDGRVADKRQQLPRGGRRIISRTAPGKEPSVRRDQKSS